MPELPEVHTFKKYFDGTSLHQRIASVEVHDDKIIRNVSADTFIERLTGREFTGSYRRGKYLFAQLDNGHHLLLHFGMTGDLNYYSEPEDCMPHERFVLHFENGQRLGFDCPRKFARILYIEDLPAYIAEIGLGEDALTITEEDFLKSMEGRSCTLKGFLLNQSLVAGVGNLYADEICFQAEIHPGSRLNCLSPEQGQRIFERMRAILQEAVERSAYYKEYPDNWFWQWREEDRPGPEGKGYVRKLKIAGRTTYYVDGCQPLYD